MVEDGFEMLLLSGFRLRVPVLPDEGFALLKPGAASVQFAAEAGRKGAIAVLQQAVHHSLFVDASGILQTTSESVHGADVGDKHVGEFVGFAANLQEEVEHHTVRFGRNDKS